MKIEIVLNGAKTSIDNPCSVANLLQQLDLIDKRLAVEVNQQLVSRSQFAHHLLNANDKVEIVHAIGGG
jgi:sulfur carrier protein